MRQHVLAEQAEGIQVLEYQISNVPELIENCITQNIRIFMARLLEHVSLQFFL